MTNDFSIRCGGVEGHVVLISCAGDYDTGGGLCAWDGGGLEVIDRLSSAGLHVASNRLYLSLRYFAEMHGGEVLTYDAAGVKGYFRSEELWPSPIPGVTKFCG